MAETFKTQRHTQPDVYPPADIRGDTKARRAWLAQRLGELAEQADLEVRIVGTGSYQRISVRRLEKVPARIQYRGTCQVCCGSVAIDPDTGLTSMHGYERPGHGYIVGQCPAAQQKPANVDLTITHRFRAQAEADAKANAEAAERLRLEYHQAMAALPEGAWDSPDRRAAVAAARALDEKASKCGTKAWHARQFVKDLDTYAIPAHGQALAEILIADGGR